MLGQFRFETDTFYGNVDGSEVYAMGDFEGRSFDLKELEILPPTKPSKIICVGLNYADHAKELDMEIPSEPVIFMKPASSIIGHLQKIVYPPISKQVDFEGELAVVIGKRCKNIVAEKADDVIAGYTCFNDITARDLQKRDGQWTRAKSFDTFAPIGPFIAPADDFDPSDAKISTRVNRNLCQDSSTSNLISGIPFLIEFVSQIMTLEIGDVIATGTPPGVGELKVGDSVEVEIEGIGKLVNEVV
ncbi:5-carboxymethyl-2-hydroxymuconateDelta-isomerase [Methanosalsum zhilinae DSM 4017]|uniref:5-carboxymethyl-2-hydroxymuconateDelta-isomerase n=1 Tax=Methanosalsum zhilinae (strain DSM 4017 / NBRC 107636 / OCM 62 / WeN5) TaxID=679901 RepID=F7XNR6_METZD|nr:fumarylacetoacetate hydrolase family protein [Methanosalsum zhilinae]AEH61267.1 5-carboxymethyl-2-hydroxymuconateDelta-isomerase [Methanosalsum zhilinae DSM 4017]